MMKKLLSVLILTCASLTGFSQSPNWLWGEAETSGSCWMGGTGIYVGPNDSIYVNGRFNGTMILGTVPVTSTAGSSEVFSGKMGPNGAFKWLKAHQYSNGNDYCYGFGGDRNGNSYSTGLTQGPNGYFADSYDKNGNLNWKVSFGSGISGYGNIGADNAGNAYVTGGFGGTQNFGIGNVTAAGTGDMFLVKYNNLGTTQWVVHAGVGGQTVGGRGVAVDPFGNIFVCGSYSGAINFYSPANTIVSTLAATGTTNLFIAKYSSAGTLLWTVTATNSGTVAPPPAYWSYNAITVDSCSNVYVTGHFINTAQFGALAPLVSAGSADIYVAKCHNNGQWEWTKRAGGTSDDEGEGIALDRHSDVYLTGYFEGTATFDGQPVTTTAASSIFVAKYNSSSGALQWVQAPSGTASTGGQGIAVDSKGFVYVIGNISTAGSATFGPSTFSGASSCGQNVLIAKLDTVPTRAIVPKPDSTYCAGQTYTLPYSVVGTFNGGNVFTAQLSDNTGSFANPVTIGSVASTTNGTISITIPAATPAGTTYLLRIISSNPITSSWANGCGAYFANNLYITNFYITIKNCSLLPVQLTSFTVECNNNNPLLKWTTATETNNDHFTIQRSEDGVNFEDEATIKATGNSSIARNYSFIDYNPLPGTTYYRLSQTDFDGTTTHLQTLANTSCENAGNVKAFAINGNSIEVQINATSSEPYSLTLMSATGQVIAKEIYNTSVGFNETKMNTQVAKGVYILAISGANKVTYKKIVLGM
jgi:hypothetical protein